MNWSKQGFRKFVGESFYRRFSKERNKMSNLLPLSKSADLKDGSLKWNLISPCLPQAFETLLEPRPALQDPLLMPGEKAPSKLGRN